MTGASSLKACDPVHALLLVWDLPTPGGSMRLNIVLVVLALFGSATSFAAGSRDQELWDAAGRGDAATVRRLLAEGVEVNAKTRYGATALFFACDKARLEVVSLLLEKGADPNVKDTFYGATP